MNTATKKIFTLIALLGIFTFSFNSAYATYTPKIKNIRIRQTTETDPGTYKIVVIVKHDDNDNVANVETELTPADKGPDVSGKTIKLSLDKSASTKSEKVFVAEDVKFKADAKGYEYEVKATMKDSKGGKIGDVYSDYNTIGQDNIANENSYAECKSTFKLSGTTLSTAYNSGLYLVNIQYAFDTKFDAPESSVAAVKLKDCNGNTTIVKLRVKYDSKSGTYLASTAIKSDAKCNWEIVAAEIGAYNKCEDLDAWELNVAQYKANGVGTRNIATAHTAKPGLL